MPLPNIDNTIDWLYHARLFSKVNFINAYHWVFIFCKNWHRTAFMSLYKSKMLPLGPCSIPCTFKQFLYYVFSEALDRFILVYLGILLVLINIVSTVCKCKPCLHWWSRMIYQYQIWMWLPSWDSWSVWFCSAASASAVAALVQSSHVWCAGTLQIS